MNTVAGNRYIWADENAIQKGGPFSYASASPRPADGPVMPDLERLFFNRLGQNRQLRRAYSKEEPIGVFSGRGHRGGAIRGEWSE